MGMDVYSEEYGLLGKIEIFDNVTGELTERKKMIHKVYGFGFIFKYMLSLSVCQRWVTKRILLICIVWMIIKTIQYNFLG